MEQEGDREDDGLVRNQVAKSARIRNGIASEPWRAIGKSWKVLLLVVFALVFFVVGALIAWTVRSDTTETELFEGFTENLKTKDTDPHLNFPFLHDDDPLLDLAVRMESRPSIESSLAPSGVEVHDSEHDNKNLTDRLESSRATTSPATTEGLPNNGSAIDGALEELKNALFSTKLQVEKCQKLKQRKAFMDKTTFEYKLASANCGWDYDYANPSSKDEPWSVVLFGPGWGNTVLNVSGCPIMDEKCPSAPLCNITITSSVPAVSRADVVVIFQESAAQSLKHLQKNFPRLKRQYHVLYFREGHTPHPIAKVQEEFDFEMGVHFYAELYNPTYMRRPSELLSASIPPYPPIPLIPLREKTKFAMWAISDCRAISQRDQYIARLTRVLGPERVHGYGGCGNRKLPKKPINNAAKLISEYKFYFSFENIIQQGYVSEKLLWILTIPVVPVYYGAPNVPNITTVPSYINAARFNSPETLAQYLLHLDAHPEEYNRYHLWRDKSGKYFSEEYLDAIRFKLAGPAEVLQFSNEGFAPQRSAQCCRLCDKRYVQWAVHQRQVNKKLGIARVTDMTRTHIQKKYFSG